MLQPPDVTVLVTVGQVHSDAGCQRVHDHFIPRMTEHDVPSRSCIAFLQLLIDCLFSSKHWLFVIATCTPLALIHANDPALVPSGPNPLVMLQVDVPSLFVTFFLVSLSACRISSSWPSSRSSWLDLCGDHRSPASRDRWLSSPSLSCSAHLCLAVRLCSFRSFLIVLAILPCSWVCSSALHVVD